MRAILRNEVWVAVGCVIASTLWIDFSRVHQFHNSDSLVMVLISIHEWTPLFWEQDRLGMLFPLLASPWTHPFTNLLLQSGMTTLVALSGFFLLGYYVAGRTRGTIIGSIGVILLIAVARFEQQFNYLIYIHQFATSAAFGVAGLMLLDRWARGAPASYRLVLCAAAGLVLILLAHWVNPGLAFALGPLLLVRGLSFRGLAEMFDASGVAHATADGPPPVQPSDRRVIAWLSKDEIVGLGAIGVGVLLSMVLSRMATDRQPYAFLPLDEWIDCAYQMWRHSSKGLRTSWYRAVEITALVGLATTAWPAGRRATRLSLPIAGGLLFAATIQYAFMTSIDHVHRTHYARYVSVAVFLWQTALVSFTVIQVAALLLRNGPGTSASPWLRRLSIGLPLAMTLLVCVVYGPVSPGVVRAEIDAAHGRYTDDLLAAGCTHVTGDYWHVWPAMFHANWRLIDEGSPRRIWGIAQRSRPTEKYWRAMPWSDMRIAEIIGDEKKSLEYRRNYRMPPVIASEQVGTVRVLLPTGPAEGVPQVAGQGAERN